MGFRHVLVAAAVLVFAALSTHAAPFDAYATLKVADATKAAGQGVALVKFLQTENGTTTTTMQTVVFHSGINAVSISITSPSNGTRTLALSSASPNFYSNTFYNLSGINSNGTLLSGVSISLTFRTADGNSTRDTTISGSLVAVPGSLASYAVLTGSSDAGCAPPALSTLVWAATSTDATAASAQATLLVSNATVVASSIKSFNISKGAGSTATTVQSGQALASASYFDAVSNAYITVNTAFYSKPSLSGTFLRPTSSDFPTAAPSAPTNCGAGSTTTVSVLLPITFAQCQDSKTQTGLAAGAASTAGCSASSITVSCASARRGRRSYRQTSSTKVTFTFTSTSGVSAGAAAQSFLQQLSCSACITAFSNNLATALATAGSTVTLSVSPSSLQLVSPTGVVISAVGGATPTPTPLPTSGAAHVAPSIIFSGVLTLAIALLL